MVWVPSLQKSHFGLGPRLQKITFLFGFQTIKKNHILVWVPGLKKENLVRVPHLKITIWFGFQAPRWRTGYGLQRPTTGGKESYSTRPLYSSSISTVLCSKNIGRVAEPTPVGAAPVYNKKNHSRPVIVKELS